jgi:hypothetical protein
LFLIISYHLDDTSFPAAALDLPIGERLLFSADGGYPPNPKYACAFGALRRHVVKDNCGLARHTANVKRILHQYENVHIVGFRLGRHE